MTPLAVESCDLAMDRVARRLADELGLPLGQADITLQVQWDQLSLYAQGQGADAPGRMTPIATDLASIDVTGPLGRSLKQPIARAVGLRKGNPHRPTVLDTTAGYGEDAWLLAGLGCTVTAVERSGVMALLLADALRRAGQTAPDIAERITLIHANAIQLMDQPCDYEVVYVDPMFPAKRKSARERKAMWVLRHMVGQDDDAQLLLEAALRTATRRVVVKRPQHAQPMAGRVPSATHRGKSHRYDIYATSI